MLPSRLSCGSLTTTVTVAGAGPHTLEFWAVDEAANVETPHNTDAFTIGVPPVAPSVKVSPLSGASVNDVAAISITATDSGAADGVKSIRYKWDGGPTTVSSQSPPTPSYTTTARFSTFATHTLTYSAVDSVGSTSGTQTATYFINDTIGPVTFGDADLFYVNSALITLTATDTKVVGSDLVIGSGAASLHYKLDGGPNK